MKCVDNFPLVDYKMICVGLLVGCIESGMSPPHSAAPNKVHPGPLHSKSFNN